MPLRFNVSSAGRIYSYCRACLHVHVLPQLVIPCTRLTSGKTILTTSQSANGAFASATLADTGALKTADTED